MLATVYRRSYLHGKFPVTSSTNADEVPRIGGPHFSARNQNSCRSSDRRAFADGGAHPLDPRGSIGYALSAFSRARAWTTDFRTAQVSPTRVAGSLAVLMDFRML